MFYRGCSLALVFSLFFALTSEVLSQVPKDTQTEFPRTNIFGTPQGNYKRQLALGLRPVIRAPGVHGHSGCVDFPHTNIFGTPQGNYKTYLRQQEALSFNRPVEMFTEGIRAAPTGIPPEMTLFEVDLVKYFKSADSSCFVEVESVTAPSRLYMVRYNRKGTFVLTLSVKTAGKAVLSDAPLKNGDFIPGSAGGLKDTVVELASDDPTKKMRWARYEWTSSFDSFIVAKNEKYKASRPTIMPDTAGGSKVSATSRTLDGFAIAGSTASSDPRNKEVNDRTRFGSYDQEKEGLEENINIFTNPTYCSQAQFSVKNKKEFGAGKYFGDYSQATLSFEVAPRKGYSIKVLTGPAFEGKASSGSTASRDFRGSAAVQLYKLIQGKVVGGRDNYIASDCGTVEIKKVEIKIFNGTYTEVDWQFSSSGMKVLYWHKD